MTLSSAASYLDELTPWTPGFNPFLIAMSALRSSPKQLIGWAFCMVIFPVIPFTTLAIRQPTFIHMLVFLALIGVVSAFIGRLFAD